MTVLPSPKDAVAWARDGAAHLRGLTTRMGDDAFGAASALPGWTRAHVLTHVARNADGLLNLLTWARTGVETPMYPSDAARDGAIEDGARRSPGEIRDDVLATSDRLADTVRELPQKAWKATVRNRQGQPMPVAVVPWLRAREMWIHAVDLDVGASFADLPAPMLAALLDEATSTMAAKPGCPALQLVDGAASWGVGVPTPLRPAVIVTGPHAELAAWLLGRSAGRELRADGARALPQLPPWL